jgi:hypothetical protein
MIQWSPSGDVVMNLEVIAMRSRALGNSATPESLLFEESGETGPWETVTLPSASADQKSGVPSQ